MASRSSGLARVYQIEHLQHQEQGRVVQTLSAEHEKQRAMLAKLADYRDEYYADNEVGQAAVHNLVFQQRFVLQLTQTIRQQEVVCQEAESALQQQLIIWMNQKNRLDVIEQKLQSQQLRDDVQRDKRQETEIQDLYNQLNHS